jgi:hypothetical protein
VDSHAIEEGLSQPIALIESPSREPTTSTLVAGPSGVSPKQFLFDAKSYMSNEAADKSRRFYNNTEESQELA